MVRFLYIYQVQSNAMTPNYKAIDIASFFIKKGVSPLKLQKLLYYSQVWYFVKTREKLFPDIISAWVYGPVIHNVWSEFKYMKRTDIIPSSRACNAELSGIQSHLDDIWGVYGLLSGSDLVDLSHSELPWMNARIGLKPTESSQQIVRINSHNTQDFKLKNGKIPKLQPFLSKGGQYSNMNID